MQLKFPELRQFVFHNVFSKCFIGFLVLGALPFACMDTTDIIFIINNFIASTHLDSFMKIYTNLATGWVFAGLAVILLFISFRYSAMMCVCGILVFIVTTLCKRYIFFDEMRPTVEFGLQQFSHIMHNYDYLQKYSFPSGHTMAAFAAAALLSYFIKNTYVHIALFIYAVLIAFSRIYLLEHFYRDVFWGALSAYCIIAIILSAYPLFAKIPNRGFLKK
ncbi:MAG: phosphatase PAP2 family protein [Bacteroidales bacterium]|jgi:membrane-associated phospholipid phosphatase|nr:phosphatase PAP2 family protein [Bacteroidales bacterium]